MTGGGIVPEKTPVKLLLFILYILLTYHSLKSASLPSQPCDEKGNKQRQGGHRCTYPLLDTQTDFLTLNLYLKEPIRDNVGAGGFGGGGYDAERQRRGYQTYRWVQVPSCGGGNGMVVNLTGTGGYGATLLNRENGNCTIPIPDYARVRWWTTTEEDDDEDIEGGAGQPLGAMLVLCRRRRRSSEKGSGADSSVGGGGSGGGGGDFGNCRKEDVVGKAPFELTRFVKRRVGGKSSSSLFGFDGGGRARQESEDDRAGRPRKLLDTSTALSSTMSTNQSLTAAPSVEDHNEKPTKESPPVGAIMHIPHFKYRTQHLVLRIVLDTNLYSGSPPYRGDGTPIPLHPYNRSLHRPILYVDENALRHSSQIEMAESGIDRPPVPLTIKVSIISPLRDVLNQQLTHGLSFMESILDEGEIDEIRYLISDERLYRFVLTQVISTVHVWFDYMAFRDEIGFYSGKTEFGGVSVSSVITRLCCSIIIFLYLAEGGGTSMVVLISVGSGVVVEAWKVYKLLKPKFVTKFPFLAVRTLNSLNDTEKRTITYDTIAITYLGLLLYPIIIGWSLYALTQYEYKSWYSWLISNLANAVYTLGFIALCPQLYVNYRLESVAHLPWKVFCYKIFNTFVDDAFAFLIDMPWKHRIMTLRDDVVFMIFLVQAYVYRVDKSRTNEFGYSYGGDGEDTLEEKEKKEERDDGQLLLLKQDLGSENRLDPVSERSKGGGGEGGSKDLLDAKKKED